MKTPYHLSAVLLFALLGKPVAAADLAPSWTLVPETAALVVRADFTKFLAALREQTKFGAVVLSEDRVRRGLELWQAEQKGEWEQFSKDLGKQGLKPDDLAQLFDGEVGLALTVEPRGDRSPLVVGLGWAEPGEELGDRLVKAIQGVIEERSGGDHPPRRVDLDLAGAEAMHLTFPVMQPEAVDPAEFSPDDVDDLTPEKAKSLREQQAEKLKNRKTIEVDRIHVFVARLGGRLLFASTFPQSSGEVTKMDEDAKREIDWDKLTGTEEATGVFARFLAAHAGQGEGGLLNTPGITATLRRAALLVGSSPEEGAVLLEVLGNPQPLLNLAGGDRGKALEGFGVGTIGPLALRMALNDRALRSGLFLSIPEPRQGLLSLLDQPTLPAAPPEWVPSGIVEFQQISFDLGVAFSKIKELAIAQGGDQARQSFVQMETAVQNLLQTDIATLLSALGHEHSMIGFPPKAEAPAAGVEGGAAPPSFNQRAGIVWRLKDEALWKRVMQTLGQFAPAVGAVQAAEEQGFSGFRLEQGPLETGLFIGRGYLVFGIGSEVTESLLSVLRNPPTGGAALRTSGLVERAAALMPSPPGLFYQLGDAGANVKATKRALEQLIDLPLVRRAQLAQLAGGPGQSEDLAAVQALVAKVKALLPSDDELQGVLGVSVSQAAVSSHGLQLQSAIELPAP